MSLRRPFPRCGFCFLLFPAFFCNWAAMMAIMLSMEAPSSNKGDPLPSKPETRLVSDAPIEQSSRRKNNTTKCFSLNSKAWLKEPRLGNAGPESGIGTQLAKTSILGLLQPLSKERHKSKDHDIIQQTFCTQNSRFVNVTFNETDDDDDDKASIRLWTVRLLYLLVHYHQHRHAIPEAQQRFHPSEQQCQTQQQTRNIGPFDFECPSAKFLIVRFYKNGIGANLRIAAVPALMAGLASDRVVLFINDAPVGPSFLRVPWTQASCDRRRDAQCFFLPASPCVLRQNELVGAYTLQRGEMRRLFRYGTVPEEHQEDRVLILNLSFRPQRVPENLWQTLYNNSLTLLTQLWSENDPHWPILQRATQGILQDDSRNDNGSYQYYGANSSLFHSLLLYAMRPNPRSVEQMEGIVRQALPVDFDPDFAIGLPIRASDKCGTETECMSFAQHVQAAQEILDATMVFNHSPAIVITTESQSILREQAAFASSMAHNRGFRAKFIVNHQDVAQDTGYLESIVHDPSKKNESAFQADDIMLSAMSSLRLQLMTRITLGNCCSNFHLLLKDLLYEGCGSSDKTTFKCLQDHPNPNFRVCCSWDKTPECLARRKDGEIQENRQMEL